MGKPKAPSATDMAQAQTGTNIGTNIANVAMTPTVTNPFGTSSTTQTGSTNWTDPFTGKSYDLPQYSSEVALNPQFQAIFDKVGRGDDKLYSLGAERISPRFEERRAALETQLVNQGIPQGSEAWNRAMTQLGQEENDAYSSLERQAYNDPLNQALAILSGVPMNTPQTSIPTTNVAGLMKDQYGRDLQAYNNGPIPKIGKLLLGGLFGA